MEVYSGLDYIKIDIADCFGLDKLNFQQRLDIVNNHIVEANLEGQSASNLTKMIKGITLGSNPCENVPKALGAMLAWRDTLEGKPTGYIGTKDGSASGIQVLSALARCPLGLYHTGLLGLDGKPNERKDVYTHVYNRYLERIDVNHRKTRAEIKQCLMTSFYGSKRIPLKVLGKEGLIPFREACIETLPGTFTLKEKLVEVWNQEQTHHTWVNADGFVSHIPVLVEKTYNLQVSGVDIPFRIKQRGKQESGLSNCANVTHSSDALILRELVRRCNFNEAKMVYVLHLLNQVNQMNQAYVPVQAVDSKQAAYMGQLGKMIQLYERTKFMTVRICENIHSITDLLQLSQEHRTKLHKVLVQMVHHKPFEVITVHDQFGSCVNKLNYVRHWYKEIMAEIVESEILPFITRQLDPSFELPFSYNKEPALITQLADLVRKSDYGLA